MNRTTIVGIIVVVLTIFLLVAITNPNSPITAQSEDACTTLVTEALQLVGSSCAEMGRNEACYGHIDLNATFRTESPPQFADSGDITQIIQLDTLTTEPLDLESSTWGVALMLVQADLPDEGDSTMTFVLMGDTHVQSATESLADLPTCSATNNSANNLNIRRQPDTDSDIVGTIPSDTSVTVNGRNETSDWLHIDSDNGTGWVFASLLTLDCDLDTLSVLDSTHEPLAPMQAFTLQTNSSGTCENVPDGLLIRSPEGQRARVIVNGVELVFSSAGYLTTPTDELLSIQGLDGGIEVTSDGQTESIIPDFYTTVPLDNLEADGPPAPPEPVSDGQMLLLPVFDLATDTLIGNDIGIEACTISTTDTVNLRGGPGTNYPIAGQFTDSDPIGVAGQAEGDDGFVWWQLASGDWVRSDLVDSLGLCSTVPSVTPPPVPTPDPNARGGSFIPESGSWRYVMTVVETDCPEGTGLFLIYDDTQLEFNDDYSTMTETSTVGVYALYGGTMSITYALTNGTTYVFNYGVYTRTLTFTSATTAIGEEVLPAVPPYECDVRYRIVATKN